MHIRQKKNKKETINSYNSRYEEDQRKSERKEKETYIRGVANKFPKEDLLIAVKCVDNQTEKLINLGLKSERFSIRHC